MARRKSKPVTPAKKATPVAPTKIIVCAKCGNAPPADVEVKVNERHAGCTGAGAVAARYIEKSVVPKDMTRFLPNKAVHGRDAGGDHKIELVKEETKLDLDEDDSKEVWSQAFYWTGAAWAKSGDVKKPTNNGRTHAEDNCWEAVQAQKANWIAFVQNAPPCDDKCFETFLKRSLSCKGFVFYIVGNSGGYLAAYTKIHEGLNKKFILYMWKGVWSINMAFSDAPAATPKL